MELSVYQQILEQIRTANNVLIALPAAAGADTVAGALGLRLFLQKLKKEVQIATSAEVSEELRFLPGADAVKHSIAGERGMTLVLNTSVKKLEELSYETLDNQVKLFLKAKEGVFEPEDVSFGKAKFPLDLVIVLGASSLDSLGQLFESASEVFYETPKINIDNKAANEHYGAINLVDLTSVCISEILFGLVEKYEGQVVDEDMATCFLAGILTKTHSFQHSQTTPKVFLIASQLVSLGARQQEIVSRLFKTKPLAFLRLWGRSLARLKILADQKAAYSVMPATDLEKSGGTAEDFPKIIKELLDNISDYGMVAVLAEKSEGGAHVVAASGDALTQDRLKGVFGQPFKVMEVNSHFTILIFNVNDMPLAEAESRFLSVV